MPVAAPHPCVPGCTALVPHGQKHCPAHTASTAHGWRQDVQRVRGRKLQKLRMDLWQRERTCRSCRRLLTPSQMIRDHIIPLAEGGTDDAANIQPLCRPCSDLKSQAEAQRGRRR